MELKWLSEIGKIKYSGTKYDDSNDPAFLASRINPLAKDEKFEKRKQANPVQKKQTVSDIGTVKGFEAEYKLEDVIDTKSGFLEDRVN